MAENSISPELLGKREAGNTAVSRHREEQVLKLPARVALISNYSGELTKIKEQKKVGL